MPIEAVEAINKQVLNPGENHFLRDRNALASAVDRPLTHWYYEGEEDVIRLAVVLLSGIAKKQAFEQGNKRTAYTAALTFLETNGYAWTREDEGVLGCWTELLARGYLTEEQVCQLLRECFDPL